MRVDTERLVDSIYFPVGIAVVTLLVLVVYRVLGPVTAIKGGYGLIAFVIAAFVYYVTREGAAETSLVNTRRYEKVVYVLAGLSIVVASISSSRFWALLVALPLGYALLTLQLRAAPSSRRVLSQIITLFLVPVVTKYLTTGFYFGSTDTFVHVRYVEQLVQTGSAIGIPRYEYFPGMHLLAGALSLVGNVDAYDSLMVLGIVAHVFLVLGVYLVGRATRTETRDALYIAAAVGMLEPILYFTTYFFPQSLAAILLLFLLYIGFRLSTADRPTHRPLTVFSAALGVAIVLTHHLTFVLFLPLFLLVGALPYVWDRFDLTPESAMILRVRNLPIVAAYASALAYWEYEDQFIGSFVALGTRILTGRLFASGSGEPGGESAETIVLGGALSPPTPALAFRSLVSPEGVYYTALAAAFLLGVGWVLRAPDRYRRRLSLLTVGVISSLLVLRTPLAIPGLTRLRHPAGIFFVFVFGVGVYRVVNARSERGVGLVVAIALVVVLGTTAPMASSAGDDLYQVNAGPDLWEIHPTPEPQVDFSDSEWVQMEAAARFVGSTESDVSTLAVTNRALDRFGVSAQDPAVISDDAIRTDRPLLLYRERWTDHRAPYSELEGGGGTVIVTDSWLNHTVSTENKVYTTGDIGLLYDTNRTFSPADG